jgi:hypothetical protein
MTYSCGSRRRARAFQDSNRSYQPGQPIGQATSRALLHRTVFFRSASGLGHSRQFRLIAGVTASPPTTDIGLCASPPVAPRRGGYNGGAETGYRWRYAWGYCIPIRIRTPSAPIRKHIQWLMSPPQQPFRSPTSYTFRCPSGHANPICSLFHLSTRLTLWVRTYVRPVGQQGQSLHKGGCVEEGHTGR